MLLKLGINGFGRIGRLFLRAALKDNEFRKKFEIVAINDITDEKTLAHLLKYDSVHGILDSKITFEKGCIIVDGIRIRIFSERDPSNLPWKKLGVDYVETKVLLSSLK